MSGVQSIIKSGRTVYLAFDGNKEGYVGGANTANVPDTKWNRLDSAGDAWCVQVANTSSAAATWDIKGVNVDGTLITQLPSLTSQAIASGASIELQFTCFNPAIKITVSGTGGDVATAPVKVWVAAYTRLGGTGNNSAPSTAGAVA